MQQLLFWLSLMLMPSPSVEINTANLDLLIKIGIPPVHAQQIISTRKEIGPFNAPSDVLDVDGVNQSTLSRVKGTLLVNGHPIGIARQQHTDQTRYTSTIRNSTRNEERAETRNEPRSTR